MSHYEKLKENPQAYHIFLALRIIEAEFGDAPQFGKSRRPNQDPVRLSQEAELAFPPTTIRAFNDQTATKPAELVNRFFGFFGQHGPLPVHLTEYARERQINFRDPSFVAFANMLTHRMMSLLYRAWVTGHPSVDFDRGEDTAIESNIAALAGLHGEAMRNRDAMPDLAKRHFTAHLALGPKNPEGLISILSGFFRAPVKMQEFVGSWLDLEPDDQWQLGAPGGLGQTTSIGNRVWSRSSKFRLFVGPVSLEDYKRLLPGSASMARLTSIVRSYVGDALDWDVNIILRAQDVPPSILGQDTMLGQTSWVGNRNSTADADDLYLTPQNYEMKAA